MTYLRINRNSVRRNPEAGSTVHHIPGKITWTEVVHTVHANLPGGVIIDTYVSSKCEDGKLVNPIHISRHYTQSEHPKNLRLVSMKQDVQTLCTLPQPKYLYEYEPLKCPCCKKNDSPKSGWFLCEDCEYVAPVYTETLSDDELEKIVVNRLNQVTVE